MPVPASMVATRRLCWVEAGAPPVSPSSKTDLGSSPRGNSIRPRLWQRWAWAPGGDHRLASLVHFRPVREPRESDQVGLQLIDPSVITDAEAPHSLQSP